FDNKANLINNDHQHSVIGRPAARNVDVKFRPQVFKAGQVSHRLLYVGLRLSGAHRQIDADRCGQAGELDMPDEIAETKRRVRALTLRLIYDNITDHERRLIGEELHKLVPDPEYMDYVFHPKEDLPISDAIDKAIEKAFQYKPIVL